MYTIILENIKIFWESDINFCEGTVFYIDFLTVGFNFFRLLPISSILLLVLWIVNVILIFNFIGRSKII